MLTQISSNFFHLLELFVPPSGTFGYQLMGQLVPLSGKPYASVRYKKEGVRIETPS